MFHGSIVALITPFTKEGELDLPALKELVDWHVEEGTDGIVVCGTTGESSTLSEEEQLKVIQTAVKVAKKRVPVIAGTGFSDTRKTFLMTEKAKSLGVDGALVIVPYYNRPTQKGCLLHYAYVAQANLPLILYHHPGRTGVTLTLETLLEICKIPSVVAIKESSSSVEIIKELCARTETTILSGDDTLLLPAMQCGARGAISVMANLIPREWSRFMRVVGENSSHFYQIYKPLCDAIFLEINPQGIKYALSLEGKCLSTFRLPLIEPEKETKEAIAQALKSYKEKNCAML